MREGDYIVRKCTDMRHLRHTRYMQYEDIDIFYMADTQYKTDAALVFVYNYLAPCRN